MVRMWKWLSVIRVIVDERFMMNGQKTKFANSLLLAFLLLLTPAVASAQNEITGVRAMGMGEAFTASATGTGALFHNPAGISALMMYSMEAAYVHDMSTGVNSLHASITDGKSNPYLGGGTGYTFSTSSDEADFAGFTGHDFYGALSFPIVPGWLIGGSTIHWLDYSTFDDNYATGLTLDAGLLAFLGDFVSLGVSARNLLEVEGANRPIQTRFGLNYHAYGFQIGADAIVDFLDEETAVSYAAGAELMVGEVVPLRAGYLNDQRTGHSSLSAGVGYRSSLVGGDILFRQDLSDGDRRMLGLALNLYL